MPSFVQYGLPFPVPERQGLVGHYFPGRLTYVSTTSLKLQMFGGSTVRNPINGEVCSISAEPTCGTGGLSAGTLYYAYLDTGLSATPSTFSLSTTAPTTNGGVLYETGDVGRLLFGAVYTVSGPQFRDTVTQRLVCSLFNPQEIFMEAAGADQSNLAADDSWKTPSTDMLLQYIKHPDAGVKLSGQCFLYHDSATEETQVGIDVGLTGTPQSYFPGNRPTGSTSHNTQHVPTARSAPTGSFVYEQSRIRLKGSSAGGTDTFDVIKGSANLLWAALKR